MPTSDTVARLSVVLSFPERFLTAPEIDGPAARAISFRSLNRMSRGVRDRAIGAATIAIHLATWMAQEFDLPDADFPDWPLVKPEEAAVGLRQRWNLGSGPLPNLVHLLEARGVRVFSLVEKCRSLDGLSFWHEATPYVFLNTTKPAARTRMSVAHELGHLLLHSAEVPSGHRRTETEANQFASSFLMPRDSILASVPNTSNLDALEEHARVWNVSIQALVYRMHEIGLISDWSYRSLFIDLNSRTDPDQQTSDSGGESSQMFRKVFDLLRAEGTGRTEVADCIHVYPDDLDALVFGLVPTVVSDGHAPSPTNRRNHH